MVKKNMGALIGPEGYVVSNNAPDSLVGRIIGIIEACGLTDKQEDSVKHLIRNAVWDTFTEQGVYISSETYGEITERHFKMMNEARSKGLPPNAV